MRVLALDTSTEVGSVALLDGGELAAEIHARVRARHAETWSPLVERVLASAGVAPAQLDLIGVGIGPGSFTGTRVGVAAAKGLALALSRPLVGVVSLEVLARGAPGSVVASIVDAHKGEVYAALYRREGAGLITSIEPFHSLPDEAARRVRAEGVVAVGSGVRRYALGLPVVEPIFDTPRGALVALLALERWTREGKDERSSLEPLYVRASDAVLPAEPLKAP